VSAKQVSKALHESKKLRVVDVPLSFPLFPEPPYSIFEKERIPGASLIDLDLFTDLNSPYPHMLPSIQDFKKFMKILGLNKSSEIVLYDDFGICGAARMWWVFKCFGLQTHVIDGGMKSWKKDGLELDTEKLSAEQIWSRGGWGYEKGKDGPGKKRVGSEVEMSNPLACRRND
jgi:3-mercaptopyruvate sulfurtransferase SseA